MIGNGIPSASSSVLTQATAKRCLKSRRILSTPRATWWNAGGSTGEPLLKIDRAGCLMFIDCGNRLWWCIKLVVTHNELVIKLKLDDGQKTIIPHRYSMVIDKVITAWLLYWLQLVVLDRNCAIIYVSWWWVTSLDGWLVRIWLMV